MRYGSSRHTVDRGREREQVTVVHDDPQPAARCTRRACGAGTTAPGGARSGRCSHAAPTQPRSHSAVSPDWSLPRCHGLGQSSTVAPRRSNATDIASTAPGPSRRRPSTRRRWWALKATMISPSIGSVGVISTRPSTDSTNSAGLRAVTHASASSSISSNVSMSSSADAVTSDVPARSSARNCVMSPCLGTTITEPPSAAGRVMLATAMSSSPVSRSCMIQRWSPGSRADSQRPIEPVPQPRSRISSRLPRGVLAR